MIDATPRLHLLEEPGPSLQEWLEQMARELVVVSGAIGSAIWLWDEAEQALQVRASCRMTSEYLAYGNQVARVPEAKTKAPIYLSYRTGVVIEAESPKADPEYAYFTEGFQDYPISFIYTAPIAMTHRRLGAIALYYADVTQLSEAQTLRVQLNAHEIAGVCIQQELKSQLGNKIEELAGANAYLMRANEEMKHLDKLKGNFMSAVSHELRTPLTAIMGYMELLEDEVAGAMSEKQLEFVRHVQDASQTLLGIVDNVLDFVRLEAGTFQLTLQEADVREVVEKAVSHLQPQFKASGLGLELNLPPTPLIARVDIRRMGQVLLNLLANAVKFTPSGGHVAVRLGTSGSDVRIEVADTGIGIASEHQGRLFDKFFQVEPGLTRNYGGVGLGLAIVKAFVSAHGGTVTVHSQPEQGSTFLIVFPVDGPETEEI